MLHRRIDVSTDHHPRVRAALSDFPPGARRYGGILLDLLYDHLLARRWHEFSDETLEDFCRRAAREVAAAASWFEQAGAVAPTASRLQALLMSYQHATGIDEAIRRTAMRLRKPEGLIAAAQAWPTRIEAANRDLAPLLSDLRVESLRFMRNDNTTPDERATAD